MAEKGIAYGVGVGPGDPEEMTLKAVRLIREGDVIAVPGKDPKESVAYKIAAQSVPELAEKELIAIDMPMVKDRAKIEENHRKGAEIIKEILDTGKNLVYITLGDSTIYCTFTYLQHYLEADGYEVHLVNGISSICAAAAAANVPIVEWDEPFHVIPGVHNTEDKLDKPGTYVLMKTASHVKEVKDLLRASGRDVYAVENCGMETQRIFHGVDAIPDDVGYFLLIIAKEAK